LSGDGLLTALKVAEAIVGEHASLDAMTKDWIPSPQLLKGVRVRQRVPIESMPLLQSKLAEVGKVLVGRGRLLVRYSGTEPLLRVMIESGDAAENERLMAEILEIIAKELSN
jgi:phosphoglucosamine mutase